MSTVRIAALFDSDLRAAPSRFKLVPWGWVRTSKGDFLVDEEAAQMVLESFQSKGVDLVIDWEHQSQGGEFARPDGKAPAAGWIRSLSVQPGEGIFAEVEWTPEGREDLAGRRYRYHSPVVYVRKTDGKLLHIRSVALTNTPATDWQEPLVAKDKQPERAHTGRNGSGRGAGEILEEVAMKTQLIGLLALKEDASDDQIVAAVKALKDGQAAAQSKLTKVCTAIGADAAAEPEKIEAAVLALKGSASQASLVEQLQAEVKTLREAESRRAVDERIQQAVKAGKLSQADVDGWARELCLKDAALFDKTVAGLPVKYPQGRTEPPADAGDTGAGDERSRLILSASREYDRQYREDRRQLLCTRDEYVEQALRDKGLPTLSDEERKQVAVLTV